MITISRSILDISLNGLEFLLNEDNSVMKFRTKVEAKKFLLDAGESEDNLEDCYQYNDTADNWKEKLNKKELIHLMVSGVHDFEGLKRTFEGQAEDRRNFPSMEPCFECKAIAEKLEMIT